MKEYILLDKNDNIIKHICADDNFKSNSYKVVEAENWIEKKEFEPESVVMEERKNIFQEEKIEKLPEVKSYIEQMKNGEIPIPMGTKIEHNEILPMSQKEILESNLPNEFKIQTLIDYLNSTDWVVIKTLELQMKGEMIKHDYSDILAERENARKRINELEKGYDENN